MTATVIDFATREHIEPAPAAPTVPCPTWCENCCDGLHERVLYHTRAPGNLDNGTLGVMVALEREDADPWPAEATLQVGMVTVSLTRQQRIDLAAALLAANDLEDGLGQT